MRNKTVTAILTIALLLPNLAYSDSFAEVFCDSTLRIDYMLTGMPGNVSISLKQMHKSPIWGGRKHNLKEPHYIGNGDITVVSNLGDTIYTNSFSSLFNEWLDLNDSVPRVCECPLLIPMPRSTVMVTARLFDKYHNTIAKITHKVDPADILIRQEGQTPLKYRYISKGTYDGPRIGVAFLAEGYTKDDMDQFFIDAVEAVDAIFSHEPFGKYRDRFDFIAIETPSQDRGVSVPKNNDWRKSSFGSHYSTFYSDRYLTSPNVFDMYEALSGTPAQHIVVLVNTEEYGGGGIYNSYTLTSARHSTHRPVIVHEFGHSFAGLADEYFYETEVMSDTYPTDVEPWEPNITTLVDFPSKWQSILPENTPIPTPTDQADNYPLGVYEGGGYSFHGIYRPAFNCRMRVNDIDSFCPACQKAIENLILFYTEPVE